MSTIRGGVARAGFRLLNQFVLPPAKAGLTAPPVLGTGVIAVETTGRVSGAARQIPLAALRVGDRYVVSTVRDDSQWLRNLEQEPRARVWSLGEPRAMTATIRRGPLNVVVLEPTTA